MSKLHIVHSHGFEVWLDTGLARCDGLCIGVGSTRDEALVSAEEDLQAAVSDLRVLAASAEEDLQAAVSDLRVLAAMKTDPRSIDPARRYRLTDDGRAIECLRCGMISHNAEDVRNRYCGHCHRFHDDDDPPATAQ